MKNKFQTEIERKNREGEGQGEVKRGEEGWGGRQQGKREVRGAR